MKFLSRKQRGLGKYDAPLKYQYEKGYHDFKHGRVFNPFHKDTMQHREWLRGFNKAYFEQLKRVKQYELKARGRAVSEGQVRHG